MGALQSTVNQVLTGATFLLQQTPGWQGGAERQQNIGKIKGLMKSQESSDLTAGGLARGSIVSSVKAKRENEAGDDSSFSLDMAKNQLSKSKYWSYMAHGAHKEIGNIISKDPKLMDKFGEQYNMPVESDTGYLQRVATKRLQELQNQYTTQKEQQEQYRESLKISRGDADKMRAMGIPEDKIKEARYN